jgi:hypothetical protein
MTLMDTTQPAKQDLLESSSDPSPDAAALLADLETVDPAEAPVPAERLAELLTEQLDATGLGATPPQTPPQTPQQTPGAAGTGEGPTR